MGLVIVRSSMNIICCYTIWCFNVCKKTITRPELAASDKIKTGAPALGRTRNITKRLIPESPPDAANPWDAHSSTLYWRMPRPGVW